jgi:hypothetical protein
MTTDPKARLDAMVSEKAASRDYEPGDPNPDELVALDLISKLDAAEAQVESLKLETKALAAERDEADAALVELYDDSRIYIVSLEVMQAYEKSKARAALKEDRDAE